MKFLRIALSAAAIVAVSSVAVSSVHAQKLDLSTITCKQFQALDQQTISLILMWMSGYYADQDAPAVIDFDKMKSDAQKLGKYCTANPSIGLITAAEETISEQ